jgi:hypothetical protein
MEQVRRLLSLRVVAVSAVIALTLGAAACGGSDDSSDGGDQAAKADAAQSDDGGSTEVDTSTPEGQVRATLLQFADGMQAGDPQKVCSVVTPAVEKQLTAYFESTKTCEAVVRKVTKGAYDGDPKVTSLKVDGDKATMTAVSATGERQQELEFVKTGGVWKISDGFRVRPEKVEQSKKGKS